MKKDEFTIDLKSVFLSAIRHPFQMLIAALILAILSGGFMAFKTYFSFNTKESYEVYLIETAMENMEMEKKINAAEKSIAQTNASIEQEQHYLEKSILMRLDPYKVYSAEVSYVIDTNYQIMPGMTYQDKDYTSVVAAAYLDILQSDKFLTEVAKQVNTEVYYISDILTYSYSNSILHVNVTGDSEQNADTILQMVEQEIVASQSAISQTVSAHSILKSNESKSIKTRPDLITSQKNENLKLTEYENNLSAAQIELSSLMLDKAKTTVEYSTALLIRKFVIYGIAGAFLGIFLVGLASVCKFIFSTKIYSASELKDRLQIVILGNIPEKERTGRYERYIGKYEKRSLLSKEAELSLAASNISNYAHGTKSLLLTGDVDNALLESLQKSLSSDIGNAKLIFGGDMFKTPETMQKLKDFDAVVIVAKAGASTYESVENQLTRLKELDRKVLGCVVID